MRDKREKNQLMLAFTDESRSEAPRVSAEETESLVAKRGTESLAMGEQEVCERERLQSRHWHESRPTKEALAWMG